MNPKNLISILVIIFFISTILSVVSLFYTVNKTTISGSATDQVGALSLIIEEEPEVPAPEAGGGPSGGGGTTPEVRAVDLLFSDQILKIITKVNRPTIKEFKITNPSSSAKDVTLQIEQLSDKITPSELELKIFPSETKIIILNVLSDEVGVETGRLVIKTSDNTYAIPIILETESEKVLFDVSLDLRPKTLLPGQDITAQTVIYNINEIGLVDVDIKYIMKDFTNKLILEDQEKITMDTQATTSKTFTIPEDLKEGNYVVIVQVIYLESVGTASEPFIVVKIEEPSQTDFRFVIIPLIIVLIIILGILLEKRIKKKRVQVEEKMREVMTDFRD